MELLVIGLDGLSYNMLERFDVDFPYLDPMAAVDLPEPRTREETTREREEREAVVEERLSDLGYME
ncbi:hypothetical protein DJ82_10985 [Halorubrum sp. Ib24]|uniref:hypothetical protein n=1 Tax=Halorubrum sp. Ib24 TaxID=1383850 RepID=UPI000B97DF62|nr:hypothetical protein [Halorubrum sp. Ib24]OYR38955.1 hypothetical protein DJ82_10985 [Halorubrum sp. Ib24]